MAENYKDIDLLETKEWIESIEDALEEHGYERTRFLLETLSHSTIQGEINKSPQNVLKRDFFASRNTIQQKQKKNFEKLQSKVFF